MLLNSANALSYWLIVRLSLIVHAGIISSITLLATNFFIYKGEVSEGQVTLLSVGMVLEKNIQINQAICLYFKKIRTYAWQVCSTINEISI